MTPAALAASASLARPRASSATAHPPRRYLSGNLLSGSLPTELALLTNLQSGDCFLENFLVTGNLFELLALFCI